MGVRNWWEGAVLPRLVERALNERVVGEWRDQVCAAVSGRVLELGFGSGLNLPHYPADVREVLAVEPAELAWKRAQSRVAKFPGVVRRVSLDAAVLDVEDASVDAVVSTWTLCTIPDLAAALGEAMRVLKPGAAVHFVEHSLAPEWKVQRRQRRLQPMWRAVAGGCHLARDIPAELAHAGFEVDVRESRYALPGGINQPFTWFVTGTARKVMTRPDAQTKTGG